MRKAIIEKEWGEVCRNGRKYEDWSWEVAFFVDGKDDPIDCHYYKTPEFAENAAQLFERGLYYTSEFGGVEFEEA